jgi:Family of unknown function (DUF6941)
MDVEFLILADSADAIGGKLYMLGGGWDSLTVNAFPTQQAFSIALGLSVPWNETNQRHNVSVELADQDGNVAMTMTGQLEVGRPPGIPPGQAQRVVLAFKGVMSIERPGSFAITAKLEDQEAKRVHFQVVPGPGAIGLGAP